MSETEGISITRVGHTKQDPTDIYVGRGPNGRHMNNTEIGNRGWLGNPYTLEKYNRAESISLFRGDFEARIKEDNEFREAVGDLQGKTLGCWCQETDENEPACHGQVIAEWADELSAKDNDTN